MRENAGKIMIEKPILFTPAMVAAILDGRKTQTRRVLKRQPDEDGLIKVIDGPWTDTSGQIYKCPYGQCETILWIKETYWRLGAWKYEDGHWKFEAQDSEMNPPLFKEPESARPEYKTYFGYHKRPSIFMPRKFSRILLRVKDVRVERVQDIEGQHHNYISDICAEGLPIAQIYSDNQALEWFRNLWNSINGKKPGCAFADNPWVWCVEFERVE